MVILPGLALVGNHAGITRSLRIVQQRGAAIPDGTFQGFPMFMSRIDLRQFQLPSAMRPLRATVPVEPYPGIGQLWPQVSARHRGDCIQGIEALVVHVARRSGTDDALALMKAGRASWHWIVPAPNEMQHGRFLWSLVPEARAALHLPRRLAHPAIAAGRAGVHRASLSVLVAADPSRAAQRPSRWQTAILAQLTRHLWARFPALTTVICRSELDPDTQLSPLDWTLLRRMVIDSTEGDLPPAVARATPLALLDRPGPAEPALRAT